MIDTWELTQQLFADAVDSNPPGVESAWVPSPAGIPCEVTAEVRRLLAARTSAHSYFEGLGAYIGSTNLAPHVFRLGELLAGRFEIIEFLAQGGMGEVYRAHDRELDLRVAVKVLNSAWITANELRNGFAKRSEWRGW